MKGRKKRKNKFLHYTYKALIQNGRMHSSMWGWEHTSRFTPYSKLAAPCENRTNTDSCYVAMDSPVHLSNINKQLRLLHGNSQKEASPKENIPKSEKYQWHYQPLKPDKNPYFLPIILTMHPTWCHTRSMSVISKVSQYLPTYRLIWILLIESEGKQLCTNF